MLVRSEDDYRRLLADLKQVNASRLPVAIDLETSGLRLYLDDEVRGISIAYRLTPGAPPISWYVPVSHAESRNFAPRRLITALNHHRGAQVYHNAVGVDWTGLAQVDVRFRLPTTWHDTQVGAWLYDENIPHGLKELASMFFGEDARAEQRHLQALRRGRSYTDIYRELRSMDEWKLRPAAEARVEARRLRDESKRDWNTFTADDIAAYAARDAELTLLLYEQQRTEPAISPNALQRELRLQGVLWRMMRTGIRVDPAAIARQRAAAAARLSELEQQFAGINVRSPAQLRQLIYGEWGLPIKHRTRSGEPSTSREALEELEWHPGIRELLEHRRLQKAMSAYYIPLSETIGPDGRIHPHFSSTRTVTGRLSCSDPNLMTIPRQDTLHGVRDVFVPDDGYELWEYDLAQAELRVQASLSRDTELMRALDEGVDLHNRTATMVWGPDFLPTQRRLAKNLNYGFSYGIGPRRFATYMVAGTPDPVTECAYWSWERWSNERRSPMCRSCHVCQAAQILADYRAAMPQLVRLMSGLESIAREQGYLPLHVEGRYRRFRSPGVIVPYYTALNALVQGGVAEVMKDMMLEAETSLTALGARLCLQVHDSLVIEVPPGAGPEVGRLLQRVADDINPFEMRMLWVASPWQDHD